METVEIKKEFYFEAALRCGNSIWGIRVKIDVS
jgi:hypothetical protein